MPDIIPPGYASVVMPLRHANLGRSAIITYGIQVNDVPNVAVANGLTNAFNSTLGTRVDNEVTFGPTTLSVGSDAGENLVIVGSDTGTGDANIDSIAANSALLVHKRTSRGGRRGRGRMYVPWCLPDSSLDQAGRIISAELALLQTECNDFLVAVTTLLTVDEMVVLHSESRPDVTNPTVPGSPNVVTSLAADNIIGTQRRRLGR